MHRSILLMVESVKPWMYRSLCLQVLLLLCVHAGLYCWGPSTMAAVAVNFILPDQYLLAPRTPTKQLELLRVSSIPSWECVLNCMGTCGRIVVSPHIGLLLAGGDSMVSSLLMIGQEIKSKPTSSPLSRITRDTREGFQIENVGTKTGQCCWSYNLSLVYCCCPSPDWHSL